MYQFLFDYALLTFPFILWILLDSWAVLWRECFWKPPGRYDAEASKQYVKCLLVVFYSLMIFLCAITQRWYLLPFFALCQQCGTEDLGYWVIATKFFKKDWTFTETGIFLGTLYPKKWPWLNGMPLLRFIGGEGEVGFWTIARAVLFSQLLVIAFLEWYDCIL